MSTFVNMAAYEPIDKIAHFQPLQRPQLLPKSFIEERGSHMQFTYAKPEWR